MLPDKKRLIAGSANAITTGADEAAEEATKATKASSSSGGSSSQVAKAGLKRDWSEDASSVNEEVGEDGSDDDSTNSSIASDCPLYNIEYPAKHDVLLGRGGETNNHSGNINFRRMIDKYKAAYKSLPRQSKPELARQLVYMWRHLNPPGRFLARMDNDKNGLWHDIGNDGARKKVSKSLGEMSKQRISKKR